MQELVCYLWDNYLQLIEGEPEIFLMGVGNAYLGVKLLLINRGKYTTKSYVVPALHNANVKLPEQTSEQGYQVSSTL
jgi:hypothetical protein